MNEQQQPSWPNCKCQEWARTGQKFHTEHHPNCPKYDPEGDAAKIIEQLCIGLEGLAADTDGLPNDCFEAYRTACVSIWRHMREF